MVQVKEAPLHDQILFDGVMRDLVLVKLLARLNHLLRKILNVHLFFASDLQFWVEESHQLISLFFVNCGNEIVRPCRECLCSQHFQLLIIIIQE